MTNKKLLFIYLIIIAITIAVIDSGITAPLREWLKVRVPYLDKAGHFTGMGLLAFLVLRTFGKHRNPGFILMMVFLVLGFATAEEFSQRFLHYRSFELWDLAANYLGILFFSLIFVLWPEGRHNRLKHNQLTTKISKS